MSAYPVVRSDFLAEAPSRGPFGLGRKRRAAEDLPRAGAHHVYVYRVDGQHVVDNGQLSPSDDAVVHADCVSLVDMGRDVPVTVDLTIPSAEASDFTVRVTFACTVTDAKRVVRENVDAASAVLAYLRRDSKLGHLALNRRMNEVNALRVDAAARIRAYTEVRQPDIHGLDVRFVDIDVLTPQELGAFEQKRREAEAKHLLARQQAGYEQSSALDAVRHEQALEGERRGGRHVAEQEEQDFSQVHEVRAQRHSHRLRAAQGEFDREQAELDYLAIRSDPLRAAVIATTKGLIDQKELADRMSAGERDRIEYEREQRQLEREQRATREQLEREEYRAAISWKREREAKREDAEWGERLEDKREDRQDRRDERREAREDRNKQLEMQLDFLRELAKRGHLDLVNVEVSKLVDNLYGGTGTTLASAGREELPAAKAAAPIEAAADGERSESGRDRDDDGPVDLDIEVKEEDEDGF